MNKNLRTIILSLFFIVSTVGALDYPYLSVVSGEKILLEMPYWSCDVQKPLFDTQQEFLDAYIPLLMIACDNYVMTDLSHLKKASSMTKTAVHEYVYNNLTLLKKILSLQNVLWTKATVLAIPAGTIQPVTHASNAFMSIASKQEALQDNPLLLVDVAIDPHWMNASASVFPGIVCLYTKFHAKQDAAKLFTLQHELLHVIYNDAGYTCDRIKTKLNHLLYFPHHDYIADILGKEFEGKTLRNFLEENSIEVIKTMQRYKEFRCDSLAARAIECPYCLQEAAMWFEPVPQGQYNCQGYLEQWQIQPYIDRLYTKQKVCQHHHNNRKTIDMTTCDGSTMSDRLIILQELD